MRRGRLRPWALALALLGAVSGSSARADVREQVALGARAVALGGAYSAVADDALSLYWNAAGLSRLGNQELLGSHADLYGTGLRQSVLGFAVPLTPGQAVALDWFSTGLEDEELDFGENRIDVAWARRWHRRLAVGLLGKYLTRSIGLDGVSQGSGKGFGMDVGLLGTITDDLHVALVGQDIWNTSLDDPERGDRVVYHSSWRWGAAWSPRRSLLLAADVDDRVHAGVEFAPTPALALRAGFQDDPGGREAATWSAGAGVRVGIVKFDYALEFHPDLGRTNHFDLGLAFNFNPSQVRIEKVEARDVYTSLYKSYDTEPMARVRLRNLRDTPLTARVALVAPDLMDARTETEILLRPRASQEVELPAVLSEKVMSLAGDRQVPLQVTVSYQSARLARTEKSTARCLAYAPGAINWGDGMEQAAAFVTTKDPAVDAFARHVAGIVARGGPGPFQNRNIAFAAGVVSALQALGLAYVPDPNNPFSTIAEEAKAVDTIHYPRETLVSRVGDCDDTTVLVAALLENLGVATRFVDVPGHIFLLFDSGIHERNRLGLPVDESMYVVDGGRIWIPIETTLLSRGFAAAWAAGAENHATWTSRAVLSTVEVGAAQGRYRPAELPGAPPNDLLAGLDGLEATLAHETSLMEGRRTEFLAARFGGAARSVVTPEAAASVAEILYRSGHHEGAARRLDEALLAHPGSALLLNNRGVVAAGAGRLDEARDFFARALDTEAHDPGIWLNLGLVRYAGGDSGDALEPVVQGLELSGGYAEAARLLRLPSDAGGRGAEKRLTAEEVRRLLRTAMSRAPARPAAPDSTAGRPQEPRPEPQAVRVAAARAGDDALREFLYWKP